MGSEACVLKRFLILGDCCDLSIVLNFLIIILKICVFRGGREEFYYKYALEGFVNSFIKSKVIM